MKGINTLMVVISIFNLSLTSVAYAQPGPGMGPGAGQGRMMMGRGSGGWGPQGSYGRMYNVQTVATIRGEVVSVDRITPTRGMYQGVRLTVKTPDGLVSVHLGPSWYLEGQEIALAPKDMVEIVGSKITFENQPTILASEVKKGDKTLVLRDQQGFPVWSAWRQRQP
jgi:hypothetical protein